MKVSNFDTKIIFYLFNLHPKSVELHRTSVSEPEPGAVEPPYFAGAVFSLKNGSGSGLDNKEIFINYNLVTLFFHAQMPLLSFSSPFLSKIEPLKPSKVKKKTWQKDM